MHAGTGYFPCAMSCRKTCFSEEESKDLHWPRNLDDLKQVSHILQAGVDKHQLLFFYGFSLLYVFKQTFAIPGSLILNVTAGLLFGTVMGTMATTILCSLGTCVPLTWVFL